MSKRARLFWSVFWIIFIVSFIITSISLLFYGLGLSFNYKTGKITQTSILIVSSTPSHAEVAFDSKKLNTPLKFNRVLPANYHVSVSLPEFQTWEKDIELKPGEVLRLDRVLLISQKPEIAESEKQKPITQNYLDPQKYGLSDAELLSLSPNAKFFAFKKNNEIWLKDRDLDECRLVTRFSKPDLLNLVWHSDSAHLFFMYQGKILVADLDGSNIREININLDSKPFELINNSKVIRYYENDKIKEATIIP